MDLLSDVDHITRGHLSEKTSLFIRVNIFLILHQKCFYSNLSIIPTVHEYRTYNRKDRVTIREISLILSKNWVAAKTELVTHNNKKIDVLISGNHVNTERNL